MHYPSVSICIVNYNGRKYLNDCLVSVYSVDYPKDKIEVILADNASTDGSLDFVKDKYPEVKILSRTENYGFAKANNLCAEAANGEYLVFLNNDTIVSADWLKTLIVSLSADIRIGVVGSKLMLMGQSGKINSAGGNIIFSGGGYDVGFLDTDSEIYNVSAYRGCVCGASMMVRRNEFIDIGMFDEDYFMYCEDVDLCWRYWLFDKKVRYISESVVYHKFGGTSGKDRNSPLRVYHSTKNAIFNMTKNYEIPNLILYFSLFFVYNIIKFMWFAIKFKYRRAIALVMAYYTFISLLPATIRKRKDVQGLRKVSDRYLFEIGIIESPLKTIREVIRLWRTD
ncbi:MAG TPA: hypothetical protein DCL42_07170 [Deltaproteobacteria bacterium]|nr:hypothetical protein [Deltaproteobacteria bacterium]